MTIDNKEMPFEVEFEIRALYDRTFDAILKTVEEADKYPLDREPVAGDCLLKISRYPTTTVVYLGLCKRIETIPLPNYIKLMINSQLNLNQYQFTLFTATTKMMYMEDTILSDEIMELNTVVSKEVWPKCEKLYTMLKNTFEAMMRRYENNNSNHIEMK